VADDDRDDRTLVLATSRRQVACTLCHATL
jgi:hypothetical protein